MNIEKLSNSPSFNKFHDEIAPQCQELLQLCEKENLIKATPVKELSTVMCVVNLVLIGLVDGGDDKLFKRAVDIAMSVLCEWIDIEEPTEITGDKISKLASKLITKALEEEDQEKAMKILMQVACMSALASALLTYEHREAIEEKPLQHIVAIAEGLNQALVEVLNQYADLK